MVSFNYGGRQYNYEPQGNSTATQNNNQNNNQNNYYFNVRGVYRQYNQKTFNMLPWGSGHFSNQKSFYIVGDIATVDQSPVVQNVYHNSNNELKLYIEGQRLFNIESITFAFSNGESKRAASYETTEDDSTAMASQTDGRTTLQSVVREIYVLNNPPPPTSQIQERFRWNDTHGRTILELQSSVERSQRYLLENQHYPISNKSMLSVSDPEAFALPGMTLHYPIIVSSEEMIPTMFKQNGNPDIPNGADITYPIGSNLKESLGFADRIIIGPEASIDNVFTTVDIKPPPSVEQPETPPETPQVPCYAIHFAKQQLYENFQFIDGDGGSGRPGGNSFVVTKYAEMDGNPDEGLVPTGKIVTVFRDGIGLILNDGIQDYRMYGDWSFRQGWSEGRTIVDKNIFTKQGCSWSWNMFGYRPR